LQDYIFIGSSPTGEDCAQVGSPDYHEKSRKELKAFINQLRRVFGQEPPRTRFSIKNQQHDFGTYGEVVCHYETSDEDSYNYAMHCESATPEYWDTEALKELGIIKKEEGN